MGDDLGQIVRLLAGSPELNFVAAEQVLSIFRRQAQTVSGFPRLRPTDCGLVNDALKKAFATNRILFVLGDPEVARRFDAILDAYAATDVKFYPQELFRARLIQAETRILMQDFEAARKAVGHYLDRIYALEGNFADLLELVRVDCEIRAASQDPNVVSGHASSRAFTLVGLRPRAAREIAEALSRFIGLGEPRIQGGALGRALQRYCNRSLRWSRGRGSVVLRPLFAVMKRWYLSLAVACLSVHGLGLKQGLLKTRNRRDVVVTRAMGGIGDLLMMTPALRALSKRQRGPIRFAIPRKFFPIFSNNPHVDLIDIDGPPLDDLDRAKWRNLTMCPAAAYESMRRPWVKKSRVELFARGMGVGRLALARSGWRLDVFLSPEQEQFADAFLAARQFGARPVIGVQPYSRDSYKDHPKIGDFILSLSRDYDVIVFHHAEAGLPAGPGIATTAGLALSQSLALVSRLQAMISGDSAFMHAAGAFDVPVFALFGPTDGALFTRHHGRATVYQNKAAYPCSPCWRNEDMPCVVTARMGLSPCVSTLSFEPVRAAVEQALAGGPKKFAQIFDLSKKQKMEGAV